MQSTNSYIETIKKIDFSEASEMSLRTAFENYINEFISEADLAQFNVLHEGKRIANFGVPDFRISLNHSMIGYIETKKTDENLDNILKSEQIKKYRELSNNLIITNYLEFIWIKDDIILRENLCYLSDLENRNFKLDKDKAYKIEQLLLNFFSQVPETISLPKDLALALAIRCRNLKDFIDEELVRQENISEQGKLYELYNAFRENIFSELSIAEFADAFAQMLIYGFFLAGLNADTKKISLRDTKYNIPTSFQLIKELITFLDELEQPEYKDTKWIIDEAISIINNIEWIDFKQNMSFQKHGKGRDNIETDPYIYFYETFLSKYDYKLRKSKGVYYTPPQIVSFITRAIDDVLVDVFKLNNGLADRNKVTLLDFATGTGTFLLEVFRIILEKIPSGSPEKNKLIIKEHILKNLYGFEYLIAPYTIAHLKLSQFLKENSYEFDDKERLQVYLTNTLEPVDKQIRVPFMPQLTRETQVAQSIKDKPILVITGNPPYSGISKNNSEWIREQIDNYKFVDGKPLGERKHWLNDDYVKFIRFAQDKMDKVEQGVVGIITNHSFLDNPTFRGMRQSLMNTFDQMYFIDLHGNSTKRETTPQGGKDENVFDIKQGVAISIFIKKKGLKKQIFHTDLFGLRSEKHNFCLENTLKSIKFRKLKPNSPYYFFIPRDEKYRKEYEKFIRIDDIFDLNVSGIVTARDKLCIHYNDKELTKAIYDFKNLKISNSEIENKYNVKDNYQWKIDIQRKISSQKPFDKNRITKISYRPFDVRKIYYDEDIVFRTRKNVMTNMQVDNIALVLSKQVKTTKSWQHCFVSTFLVEGTCVSNRTSEIGYAFPLYILKNGVEKVFFGVSEPSATYDGDSIDNKNDKYTKFDNFKIKFSSFITKKYQVILSPEQIFGYIYAILHSKTYRAKYEEFLRNDFARIPFVDELTTFEKISNLGYELVEKHLLHKPFAYNELSGLGNYPIAGDNIVTKVIFKIIKEDGKKHERLYINEEQYFDSVPEDIYLFRIGGYQVLDKYLKDRRGRSIENELFHITEIIKTIHFTIEQMKKIEIETKDWV